MVINIHLIENGSNSILQIWAAKKQNMDQGPWVEIRGNLDVYDSNELFHQIHDIKRINVSDLHAGRTTQILPEWEGYDLVKKVLENQ